MRVRALSIRILKQMIHDKRTMALLFAAPLLLLTLVYFLLDTSSTITNVAVINASESYIDQLEKDDIIGHRYSEGDARLALERGEVVATVNIVSGKSYIELDGSDLSAQKVLNSLERARLAFAPQRPDLMTEVNYIYGDEDLSMFDNYGSVLIGFIIFFFVFLLSGISFLQERTTGTLEKLLSTPIKRWEVVCGYVLGFGVLAILQATLISWYCVYVLDIMMVGSFFLIIFIALLSAMTALTLGMLISTAANSEFQMMQFIPVVVIPQFFFSGIFELSTGFAAIGKFMPLYYIADALTNIMIKGNGLSVIVADVLLLIGFTSVFIILNIVMLKKYRSI